jgi:hypothetical protein
MIKIATPILLALTLTPANAAVVSYKLPTALGNIAPVSVPGMSILPLSLPTINATIAAPALTPALTPTAFPAHTPVSLPVYPVPAIGPARLPGVPSPLPLPVPAALLAAPRSAPSIREHFAIDWSLLDDKGGDEAAAAMVPNNPGPKPLSPAGALKELLDPALGSQPRGLTAENPFDGRRKSLRELELPHGRYL